MARAALLGARGNSGVILSQIVRGAAEELASRQGELVDPVLVSAALARAADAAYASVRDPAEGTMLSAMRAMSGRVAHDLAHMDPQRLGPESSSEEQDELLAQVLENALEAGTEAVERGPDQLAVLREAGVVDAGAYGLTVIVAGCLAALRGSAAPELEHQIAPAALHRPEHESSSFRYCTNFAVTGAGLEASSFVPGLETIGDSVLVVGDERTLRVHLHTDEPERAVAIFDALGEVSRFDVADMHEQVAERSARLADRAPAARGHVHGRGGGQRRGRSAALRGARRAGGGRRRDDEPVHLRAARGRARCGRRGGARPAQQPQRDPGRRARRRAVREARPRGAHHGAAGGPCRAARVRPDRGRRGERRGRGPRSRRRCAWAEWPPPRATTSAGASRPARRVGYAGGELVAWGDPERTLAATLERLAGGTELVTCLAGAGAPLDREWVEAHVPDGVEVEYHEGGQPAWWWLLCAE